MSTLQAQDVLDDLDDRKDLDDLRSPVHDSIYVVKSMDWPTRQFELSGDVLPTAQNLCQLIVESSAAVDITENALSLMKSIIVTPPADAKAESKMVDFIKNGPVLPFANPAVIRHCQAAIASPINKLKNNNGVVLKLFTNHHNDNINMAKDTGDTGDTGDAGDAGDAGEDTGDTVDAPEASSSEPFAVTQPFGLHPHDTIPDGQNFIDRPISNTCTVLGGGKCIRCIWRIRCIWWCTDTGADTDTDTGADTGAGTGADTGRGTSVRRPGLFAQKITAAVKATALLAAHK